MDQLPNEIAVNILSLACFDDKATGCALSLTSKRVAELLEPRVLFEAVSLYGLTQISAFASFVERCSKNSPCHVRHMFLSGLELSKEEDMQAKRIAKTRKQAIVYKLIPPDDMEEDDITHEDKLTFKDLARIRGEREAKESEMGHALSTIMAHSASSLKTLFMTSIFQSQILLSPLCSLPQLTDLSVTSSSGLLTFPHDCPKLRRIHTTCNLRHWSSKSDVDFTKSAPALVELRLTNVTENEAWLLEAFSCYITRTSRKQGILFPPTMKRVMLQQCSPPYGAQCGNSYMQHNEFRRALNSVVADFQTHSDEALLELVLLPEPTLQLWSENKCNGLGYFFHDARRDWNVILSGEGKGAWDAPSS